MSIFGAVPAIAKFVLGILSTEGPLALVGNLKE
jgi:hypothetical protein